ncbi:hypothetical protein BKA70DRAFT_1444247 [Coprinopsis sp. MPI-PUGE-AT-0042]|nr:hypothetical protein BKA70DRAFT_1444247 [Coprinopsis sp. MPI-PUGE-AT-0042]
MLPSLPPSLSSSYNRWFHDHLTLMPPYAIHLMDECQVGIRELRMLAARSRTSHNSRPPLSRLRMRRPLVSSPPTAPLLALSSPTALTLMVHRHPAPAIYERPAPRLASSARSSSHHQLATMVPLPEFPDPPPLHATNRFIDRLEGGDPSTNQFRVKFKTFKTEQSWSSHDEPDIWPNEEWRKDGLRHPPPQLSPSGHSSRKLICLWVQAPEAQL